MNLYVTMGMNKEPPLLDGWRPEIIDLSRSCGVWRFIPIAEACRYM